ncbi:hypothetical protein M8997_009890 [Phyllobacterium sp. 21LDTY02-6]|uniref:hypothetical protein n=1 Tax=Phyllobacterium sp. 21LDTY02-6 TaxID=2944903 RepID=UPI00202201FB|nr:hypothetical protein [Phyllobacterium sp. 21LDTY02-6]MCO4317494.1 hypothetical protein [Phyllobacterium sp. 21LDTY02-6]
MAPDLDAQYENVGADLRDRLYKLIEEENAERQRAVTDRPAELTDFRRVILDIALNEDQSGIADAACMVLLKALCMGESSEREILEARRQKVQRALARKEAQPRDQFTPLPHFVRVPNFG